MTLRCISSNAAGICRKAKPAGVASETIDVEGDQGIVPAKIARLPRAP